MKRDGSRPVIPLGLLCLLLLHIQASCAYKGSSGVLQSLRYYQTLRNNSTIARTGNLDSATFNSRVGVSDNSSTSTQEDDNNIGNANDDFPKEDNIQFCHIIDINRHTVIRNNQLISLGVPLQHTAAVLLAQEHLNTGNGRVVEEVGGLNERCNIRFSAEFLDTQGLESHAVDQLYHVLTRSEFSPSATATTDINDRLNPGGEQQPCAFIGAWRSAVSIPLALLTSMKGYPQFSGMATADQLDDTELFPLFGRLVPSNSDSVGPLLDFIANELLITHIAVVHTDDTIGIAYINAFRENAETRGITIQSVGFADDTLDFSSTVQVLKESNYRFFVGSTRGIHYSPLMEEAYKQGIAGTGEHNWLFTVGIARHVNLSPVVQKASIGVMQFMTKYPFSGVGNYQEYLEAIHELGDHRDDLEYLQSKIPTYPEEPTYDATFSTETFDTDSVTAGSAIFYDTMIALGLGACNAANLNNGVLDGIQHYKSTVATSFVGASGTIELDSVTGSRKASSTLYALTNYVFDELSLDGSPDQSIIPIKAIETHYYHREWIYLEPIIFSDGTTNIPLSLPEVEVDMNYIGYSFTITGLILAGFLLAFSIICSTWTMYYRRTRVVRASQPIFLIILCVGTFFCGISLIPLSIDDEIAGEQGANIACLLFPWFFSIGWVISFSTLFVKTRRVVRIFNSPRFRRVAVKPKDVFVPILVLLGANVLVLTVWTFYGLNNTWERSTEQYDEFGRPTESFGRCKWHDKPAFLITLFVIDLGSLLFAIMQAWAARKISTEYSESEWIAKAVFVMFVIAFVGVPILAMAEENTRSFFFVLLAMVFLTAVTLLFFIFLPKMYFVWYGKNRGIKKKNGSSFYVYRPATTSNLGIGNETSHRSSVCKPGILVLDHPRMKDELEDRIDKLTDEIRNLKAMNAQLLKERDGVSSDDNPEIAREFELSDHDVEKAHMRDVELRKIRDKELRKARESLDKCASASNMKSANAANFFDVTC